MKPYPRAIDADSFATVISESTVEPATSRKISVLYHSVKIQPMTWLEVYKATTDQPDGSSPGLGNAKLYFQWLQHRLNEIGFLAGPLTGAKDDQTKRAISRYSYALRGVETEDETLIDGDAGASTGAKADFIETAAALGDKTKSSRIILDHNFCVVEPTAVDVEPKGRGECNSEDGHVPMEARKLDRFCHPFKATLLLLSKDDRAGNGKGVEAPKAIGPVNVEWRVFDPPEDVSVIGAPFTSVPASVQTKSPKYLDDTRVATAGGDVKSALKAFDNCPVAQGGIRPASAADMTPYFRAGALTDLYADQVKGTAYLSTAMVDPKNPSQEGLRGTAGALFWGSYIAGDNWMVRAKLSFEAIDGKEELIKLHKAVPKLAKSFGDDEPTDPLSDRTGKLTIWRRHRVLSVVDWWSNAAAPNIQWDVIEAGFRAAHIIMVPPGPPVPVGTISNAGQQLAYATEMIRVMKAINSGFLRSDPAREADMRWQNDGIVPYPFPIRPQNADETLDIYSNFILNAPKLIAEFAGGTYQLHRLPGDFVRTWLGGGNGQVIIRFDHLAQPDLNRDLNAKDRLIHGAKPPGTVIPYFKRDGRGDGGPSIGVSGGAALIEHQHADQFLGSFIVAHEMGHNYYLTHPHDMAADHDKSDENCTMKYPSTSTLGPKGWGTKSTPGAPVPLFCGKCILKLRGWKIRSGIPDSSG